MENDYRTHRAKRWYGSKRWQDRRRQQLAKEPLCYYCAAAGRTTPADTVDHTRPHRGDESLFWDPDNLTSTCKHCHDSVKQQLEKTGQLRGCDVDGWPLDPGHLWNQGPHRKR